MNRYASRNGVPIRTAMILLVSSVFGAVHLSAQTATSVIGAGAVTATNSEARIAATVGQSAIGFIAAPSAGVSQGFWRPRNSISTSAPQEASVLLSALRLSGAPNPLSRETTLSYHVPHKGHVSLILYNAIGRQVMTLVDEERDAGVASEQADMSALPSGSYRAVLRVADEIATVTLLLVD